MTEPDDDLMSLGTLSYSVGSVETFRTQKRLEYGENNGIRISYKLDGSVQSDTMSRLKGLMDADADTEKERKVRFNINKDIIKGRMRKKLPGISSSGNTPYRKPSKARQTDEGEGGENVAELNTTDGIPPVSVRKTPSKKMTRDVEKILSKRAELALSWDAGGSGVFDRVSVTEQGSPKGGGGGGNEEREAQRQALAAGVGEALRRRREDAEARLHPEAEKRRLRGALSMEKGPGRWHEEYQRRVAERHETARKEAELQAVNRAKAQRAGLQIDFSWMHNHVKTETEVKLKRWDGAHWQRNAHCEVCWTSVAPGRTRVACGACNVVCHAQCADARPGAMTICGETHFCRDCLKEATKIERKRQEAALNAIAKSNYKNAALELKYVMRLRARIKNRRKFKDAVVRFQAWLRGRGARRQFRRRFGQLPRLWRLRVLSINNLEDMDRDCGIGAIITINSEESQLESFEDLSFSSEKQLFRFETDLIDSREARRRRGGTFGGGGGKGGGGGGGAPNTPGRLAAAGAVEKSPTAAAAAAAAARRARTRDKLVPPPGEQLFFVPGTTPYVQLVVTVVGRDDVDLKLGFHGQARAPLHAALFWNRRATLTLPLGPMELPPKDPAGGETWISGADGPGAGDVTVEVVPWSFYRAKCGHAEVVKESTGIFRQKRWLVLVDSTLNVYGRRGEARPRSTLYLQGAQVAYHEKLMLRVQLPDTRDALKQAQRDLVFLPTDLKDRQRWYNLLRRASGIPARRQARARNSLYNLKRQDTIMESVADEDPAPTIGSYSFTKQKHTSHATSSNDDEGDRGKQSLPEEGTISSSNGDHPHFLGDSSSSAVNASFDSSQPVVDDNNPKKETVETPISSEEGSQKKEISRPTRISTS